MRERRRKTLVVKGKLARVKAKLRKIQVRGVLLVLFIVISYDDEFWIMFEL